MVSAAFFDIFGVAGFLVLLITGLRILKKSKEEAIIIIVISSIGLVVDFYNVVKNFIL